MSQMSEILITHLSCRDTQISSFSLSLLLFLLF